MKHILFGSEDLEKLQIALLIKDTGMNQAKLEASYIAPGNLPADQFVALNLEYDKKKVSAKCAKEYIQELLPVVDRLKIQTLLVCDGDYFKYLTGNKKADPHYGYVCPCSVKGFEHLNIIVAPNFQALLYNPNLQQKMNQSLTTLEHHLTGSYQDPGKDIIQGFHYPEGEWEIAEALGVIKQHKELTCDIEGLSLDFWTCGLSTISFAWTEHRGMAFAIDRETFSPDMIQAHLKRFFETYKGKLIFHNAGFDIKVLIYNLWMKDLGDYEGMLEGIRVLTRNFDDTKLIAYLATNNAVKNVLGLKELSAEFTGDYAEDTTDTSKIPLPELLEYNLKDCLATWYVKKKYEPIMDRDQQRNLYETLFKPIVRVLLQTELCGMPIFPDKVKEAEDQLTAIREKHLTFFENNPIVQEFQYQRLERIAAKKTAKAKKKVYTIDDPVVAREVFNPGSHDQLRELLYDHLGFPVIELTDTKQPSTSSGTLEDLENHTDNDDYKAILKSARKLSEVSIILSTFIKAFKRAQQLPDGSWRLYGNFNLGGTQSLRLSSSKPNLQNIPSNSTFAKIIKACFRCIPGWIFGGSDFDALEDKCNALLTKDPNKLAVYESGYDGHCLRAHAYFKEQMPDINLAEEGDKCFRIKIDHQYLYCKSGDYIIDHNNKKIPVEDYYETLTSGRI